MSLRLKPKVDSQANQTIGPECLPRWHDKNFGNVSRGEFFPIVKKYKLMESIDKGVVKNCLTGKRNSFDA